MAQGYVLDNVPKSTIRELPESKVIPYELGDFKVLDCYYTATDSNKSTGQTIMWFRDKPVWIMCYGGEYADIAIPFLKQCLHRAYVQERRFYGGRGPHFVRGDRFTYTNDIRQEFIDGFEGEERIFDLSEQPLGYHWYRGMSLLQQD